MTITLLQLREQSRQRADMQNSEFITDSELTNYINSSIAELTDLLISCYENDYNISTYSFTTTANVNSYALPADFYKLRGVDTKLLNGSADWYSLRPFNFNERNRNQDWAWGLMSGPGVRYRLLGGNLYFSPAPDSAFQCKLWYTPVATKLAADADTLNDLNQYAEYVITDAAIKMLQKEESDVSVLVMQKSALVKRIQEMASNRDSGQPESISDIYAENDDHWFRRT